MSLPRYIAPVQRPLNAMERGQISPRPFFPGGVAPPRATTPRSSFMGPNPPLSPRTSPRGSPSHRATSARHSSRVDRKWASTADVTFIDFYKAGMLKGYPQFQTKLHEGAPPPLTPQQRIKKQLEKDPWELADELLQRTYSSDIFNKSPPREGYWEAPLTGFAFTPQRPPTGDSRPKWKW